MGLGLLAACLLAEAQGLKPFPASLLQAMAERLAPLAPWIAPWEELRPWILRDKKAAQGAIACVLPRPEGPALIRPLPPEAWAEPARLLKDRLLTGSPRG